jgi:transcriptional regulator GlxA family with amidase domain
MPVSVAIYVFPNVEVLDFAGPFEVFSTASRVHARRHPEALSPFEVFTVAQTAEAVQARAGLRVVPDYCLHNCPQPNVLLIPGGVVDEELRNPEVVGWITERAVRSSIVASVCTGAFVLAEAGLLEGKVVTTHWEDLQDLQARYPSLKVQSEVRWVDEGSVVTSAGIAAGIDMSLHLVARLATPELAEATARQMDVPYRSVA